MQRWNLLNKRPKNQRYGPLWMMRKKKGIERAISEEIWMKGHQHNEGIKGEKGNNDGFTINNGKSDEIYPKASKIHEN